MGRCVHLAEIRNNPNITKPKLADTLKIGKTTVDKGIAVLKEYGFIERVGSNKSGYWNVLTTYETDTNSIK